MDPKHVKNMLHTPRGFKHAFNMGPKQGKTHDMRKTFYIDLHNKHLSSSTAKMICIIENLNSCP